MKILKNIIKTTAYIAVFILIGYQMVKYFVPGVGKAPEKEAFSSSPYYAEGQFKNTIPTSTADFNQLPTIIKEYISRKAEKTPKSSYIFHETDRPANDSILHINWLGHAAILLRKNGKYILADPMLTQRASPVQFMGPKRFSPSPIQPENLPDLEAVVISHDHYDHLDYQTIKKIVDKTKYFYVPLGVKASLLYWGVPEEKIMEFGWWDSHQQPGFIRITATPARHFSGRLLSQNNTFWASWVIEFEGSKIYFGGDTGIFEGFQEIDEKLGPFDLAFLPIGAYYPAWHDIHMNPAEAVQAFRQMRANHLFPIHWGTFDLALHSWYEPIEQLEAFSQADSLPLLSFPQGKWFNLQEKSQLGWWKKYAKTLNANSGN